MILFREALTGMFEKLKKFFDKGKSMLNEALTEPEEDDFVTVPEGVTLEQLIEESKQYVDAIIVTKSPKRNDSPTVFLKTGDSDEVPDTEISIPESDTEGTADDQAEASDKDAEPEDTEEGQNTDK